jgi:Tol biopolymer transport system component
VTTWSIADPHGSRRTALVAVETTTGGRRTLVDDPNGECGAPAISPDGRSVAFLRESLSTPDEPVDIVLRVVPLEGGEARDVAPGWDRWPDRAVWSPGQRERLRRRRRGGQRAGVPRRRRER